PQTFVYTSESTRPLKPAPDTLGKECNDRVDAPSERVPRLGQDLAGLGDVHAVPASRVDVRRGAVQDRLRARVLALRVRVLDCLRGERPDSMVLPQGERVPGFGEMVLGLLDISAALARISHTGFRFFDDSLEDPLASLVERPDGDAPKQALRRGEVPAGHEGPSLVDIPLKCQRFNAGLLRPVEDRVRVRERIGDASLPPRDLEDPPSGTGEIQRPSQVAGGLRLLRPFQ